MVGSAQLGVIGGSGIYQTPGLEVVEEIACETPFGPPSAKVARARVGQQSLFFLPRHGLHHKLLPSEVPFRANIYALKSLGVTHILAMSAVGIMAEHIERGDFVLCDQIYDLTKGVRPSTFYGAGSAGHLPFAEPFCPTFRAYVASCLPPDVKVHPRGTYLCIEGPRFSTRHESHVFRRTIGPDVIGMTGIPEASLAREAGISYAMLAMATDFDCWKDGEVAVEAADIIAVMRANAQKAEKCLAAIVANFSPDQPRPFQGEVRRGLLTDIAHLASDQQSLFEKLGS